MRTGKFKVYRRDNTLQFTKMPQVYWYFNLIAANGKVIATSEMYTTKRACINGIKSVIKNAATATIENDNN